MGINEGNVVQHLKKRNEKALDFIISNYGGLMKSIVKKHLYQLEHVQDDCMNDILLAVWDNIDKFCEEKNTFKNWLAAIAKYKSIDYKRKYLRLLEQESIDEKNLESALTVDKRIIENELSYEFESLLNNLSKEDKELFIKYYVEEKDVDSIVREVGIKSSVIYNRLSRGRRKLRSIFTGYKT